MHEHNDCEHELKYCKKCDVAYCEKCGKEWRNYNYTISTYPNYPSTTWLGDGTIQVTYTDHTKHNVSI